MLNASRHGRSLFPHSKPTSPKLALAVAALFGLSGGFAHANDASHLIQIDSSREYVLFSQLNPDYPSYVWMSGGKLKMDQSGTFSQGFDLIYDYSADTDPGLTGTLDVNGQNLVFTGEWSSVGRNLALIIEGKGTVTFAGDKHAFDIANTVFNGEKLVLDQPYIYGSFEIKSGELEFRGALNGYESSITLAPGTTMSVYPDTYGSGWNKSESPDEMLYYTTDNTRTRELHAKEANLHFYIPSWWEEDMVMLPVRREADITDAHVSVGINGSVSSLQPGSVVTLIRVLGEPWLTPRKYSAVSEATDNAPVIIFTGTPANETATAKGMQGVTLEYDFALSATDNELLATVTRIGVTEPAQDVISGSHLSGIALLTMGSDLISERGIALALDAARMSPGLQGFGAINGGKSKYDPKLSLKVKGYNALAGLAYGHVTEEKHFFTVGGFFEFGSASYDLNTHHAASEGDTDNVGAGLLARVDFAENEYGYFYTEGSFRGGRSKTNFTGELGCDADETTLCGVAGFKNTTPYIGASLGTGYVWNLEQRTTLNTYIKFLWTHLNADSATLSSGETLRFDSVNSDRLKAGTRISRVLGASDRYSVYAGLAVDHEFDAKAVATTNDYALHTPKLKGTTGMGEIGLAVRPIETSPFSINLSLEGFVGHRKGYTGGARAYYAF
ncbi:MAG: autotransporter outer membrane beta-barrel domain-containing protein [Burkholderiales bacterium]|jgi:hypothetical protein|nr:autotransporter outer membrane beta-barrel domain-containing protein [Burkholderiales bacterium]